MIDPANNGYWQVAADGGVFAFGGAGFYGSMGGQHLNAAAVGMASTPDGSGYWLVASDGGIFSFGDANFYGSMGGQSLNKPVVGMASTPDGHGYWLVASDGGIFSFGDANFYGSMGGQSLNKPVVGMASTPDGHGYWLVGADGGIFSFGDANFYGSMGGQTLNAPVVNVSSTPNGAGYLLSASDGGVFNFGNSAYYGHAVYTPPSATYANPLRGISGLVPERVDQGVDYAGSGPLYALGDGLVLQTNNSGWPGGAFIAIRLTDGPAAGDVVYEAENITPSVQVGQTVTPNTVVGTLIDASPNMEIGWGNPNAIGEAYALEYDGPYQDGTSSAFGINFNQLLVSLGAPSGIISTPVGSLPPGWPSWG